MKSRAVQRRRLLMKSYDDDEATPLSEDNIYLLRILDRYEEPSSPSCSQARERSPIVKSVKAPKTAANGNELIYSDPMIKSCRLQAQRALIEPGTTGKGNSTTTSATSSTASRVIKKAVKKKTDFRGFGYLLGLPGTSTQPDPPIVEVDLTDEKTKKPSK